MKETRLFEPKKNLNLIGYKYNFNLLKNLILTNKFPKIIMLSGEKGIGKATFVSHLMHYYFDKFNYNENDNIIKNTSPFHLQFNENTFPNISYLDSSNFKNINIDDIRKLKIDLSKTSINNDLRFIILDGVENFNTNSLNALLKQIEEPSRNNYFILINNQSKLLIKTIKSRCVELKIILNKENKKKIVSYLAKKFNQNINFNYDILPISPGNFLIFNNIINENNLDMNDPLLKNFKLIINLYKKEKNSFYKDFLLFITDYYFQKKKLDNPYQNENLLDKILFLKNCINNFFLYNLNQNTFLNSIENKIK